jgi:putative membrane protein
MQGTPMFRLGYSLLIATALCSSGTSAMAQSRGKLTDPQINYLASEASLFDFGAADSAMKKTRNKDVQRLASEMAEDHDKFIEQLDDWLKKQKVESLKESDKEEALNESDFSRSLFVAELSKLRGATFDKAYVQNEVAYHKTIIEMFEKELIPNAQNGDLKSLLQTALKLFQAHQIRAERLVSELK